MEHCIFEGCMIPLELYIRSEMATEPPKSLSRNIAEEDKCKTRTIHSSLTDTVTSISLITLNSVLL